MIIDEQHDFQKAKESVYILERGLLKKTVNPGEISTSVIFKKSPKNQSLRFSCERLSSLRTG